MGAMKAPLFVFAGGGTGGHLYPALAIWEELADLLPGARAVFVCSSRAVDAEVLGGAGVEFVATRANYPSVRPRQLWRFVSGWPASVRAAREVMQRHARETGGPVHVVTLGGFVAAPAVQAARVERAPVTLVNIDAVPGRANRWIARHAQQAFTTVADARFPRWQLVAPVVRRAARSALTRAQAREQLGLPASGRVLLVTGGSLGARSLNQMMEALCQHTGNPLECWHVLHQTGHADDSERLRGAYTRADLEATVVERTAQLPVWWAAADVALSRAGAGAVAEAWSTGTPTVFAPYPYHKDQHQRLNARQLVQAGAAVVGSDRVDPHANLTGELGEHLVRLLTDEPSLEAMRVRAQNLGPADGAVCIAKNLAGLTDKPGLGTGMR
jgi:UDP-N-acetylglucosamine--N-acetylmuramyl-(pentapeptide) pyrophosphoryl-undecaprenol N-acetylglucosamine transferase